MIRFQPFKIEELRELGNKGTDGSKYFQLPMPFQPKDDGVQRGSDLLPRSTGRRRTADIIDLALSIVNEDFDLEHSSASGATKKTDDQNKRNRGEDCTENQSKKKKPSQI